MLEKKKRRKKAEKEKEKKKKRKQKTMRARVLSNGHGNANAIESSSGLIGRSLPRRPPFRLERAIETSRWLTSGKGGGKGEDRLKGQIPVSFLPFVFSYFPMGGS